MESLEELLIESLGGIPGGETFFEIARGVESLEEFQVESLESLMESLEEF